MKQRIKIWAILSFGFMMMGVFIVRQAQGDALIWAPEGLASLIDEALVSNDEIKSIEAELESLKEEIPLSASLEDPRLGIGILNLPTDTFNFDQEPMTQKQIFVAQKLPWFGKLSLKEKRQIFKVAEKKAFLDAKRFELARTIAAAYYDLGFVVDSLEINKRLKQMLAELIRVAETRYATGGGLQQDVLLAQVELSKLLDEEITLEKRRRMQVDKINELIGRPQFQEIIPHDQFTFFELEVTESQIKALSLNDNPWLKVRKARVDQRAVEIELARKAYWPDMDFKLAYGQRDEDRSGRDLPDFVSATMTVNIPLWRKSRQDRGLAAAKKRHEAADKSWESLSQALPYRIDSLLTEISRTQENYRLFSDAILLQAEQWARSSLSAYVVGKVEFNTMINSHIRLLRLELQTKRYLFNACQKRAELEQLIGGPIPSEWLKDNPSSNP